jgi:hypothetical protein
MKATNVKLQLELEGVMKRLAEVEVEKDTKGTFMFGGGRVSNAALRLGVRLDVDARHIHHKEPK